MPSLLSLTLFIALPATAVAQTGWSPAVLLNDPAHGGDIKEPKIWPAAIGGFHAVYRHFGGSVEVYYRRVENGLLRPLPVRVHNLGFLAGGDICESGDGSIHLVWENWDDVNEQIWWARSTDGGLTFPQKQVITAFGTNPNGQAKNPVVVPYGAAGGQVLALSWNANPVNRLFHNRWTGTAWTGNTDSGISTSNSYAAWGAARHPVDGSVWRTYGKEVSGEWQIAARRFNGTSWGSEEMVTAHTAGEFPSRPNVAINEAGEMMVVWDADTAVWSRLRAASGTWGPMLRVDGGYTPAVTAVPGTGEFQLVHPYPPGSYTHIVARRWLAGAWTPRTRISSGIPDGFSPNCDVAADPQGNIHCVWEYWGASGAGPPRAYYSTLPNLPPAILTAPAALQGYLFPATVTLVAAPSTTDVTLTKVEFYAGAVKLGEKSAAPFTFDVTGLAPGTHQFHVTGTSTTGEREPSDAVPVTIVDGSSFTWTPAGSTWRYLDTGVEPDSLWKIFAFNDGAWLSGPAQLGFGDGDEARVINGGPASARFITTWFRRTFDLTAHPKSFKAVSARLLRDDGAVVYLNGTEVFRSNMPAGAITAATTALDTINVPDESAWHPFVIDPARLVAGTNIIAVELHQSTNTSSDLSFDLEMTALKTNPLPPSLSLAEGPSISRPAGLPVSLTALVNDDDGDVVRVQFFLNGIPAAERTTAPWTVALTNIPAGTHTVTAFASDNDGRPSETFTATLYVFTALPPATPVGAGAAWRFLDTGGDPGVSWTQAEFPDAGWPSGPGELGYGDNDEATVINGGPAGARFMTAWFRHKFTVSDPARFRALRCRFVRDDGIVVHLNGSEAFRDNMPEGAIGPQTPAVLTAGGTDESAWFERYIDPSRLHPGVNTLAVEVHQSAPTSGDLGFNLELTGFELALPKLSAAWNAGAIELRWPLTATGWSPESSTDLAQWTPVTTPPVTSDGSFVVTLPAGRAPIWFFRLRWN